MKAKRRIPPAEVLGAARPSPLPGGEGASNSASVAGVLWRGLWPLCQLLEKPLPASTGEEGKRNEIGMSAEAVQHQLFTPRT